MPTKKATCLHLATPRFRTPRGLHGCQSTCGVLTDVFRAVTDNRPANWKTYFNAFEIAKTLTMEQVVLAYMPATSWGTDDAAKKCCHTDVSQVALRVNILEAELGSDQEF
eukprot:g14262.t1